MITIRLMGGLGNQMFQKAYGVALEHKGYQVQFDKSFLCPGTHKEYSLSYFNDRNIVFGYSNDAVVYEGSLRYQSAHLSPKDPSTRIGYWQSEKYFSFIANKVRDTFRFHDKNLHSLEQHQKPNIAIHVRRQDYTQLQHFHGMPSLNYYREGIKYIRERVGVFTDVFVFSDDAEWCYENFPKDFTIVNTGNKYEDLKMMVACDNIVIANSSFSWWAAWLGDNRPKRIVVAPKKWFADQSVDSSDIVPDRWIRL